MNYTAKQLANITGSELLGDGNARVKNIAFDSRTIYSVQNTAFIALQTSKNSGENYIPSVIEKGITVIISTKKPAPISGVTYIITEDTTKYFRMISIENQ